MRKIALFGIASSGDNYGKPYIFSNIEEPTNDRYPFSYAETLLGDNPADVSQIYTTIEDNDDQLTHFRSLIRSIKHIELLCSTGVFLPGEIEVYCYKVTNGTYSIRKVTDNSPSPISGAYSTVTGQQSFYIESIKKGDEYNYFNIQISGPAQTPTLTLSYETPSETKSIKIIDDESIYTPFVYTLKTNSVSELTNAINASPFGQYIQAKHMSYFNKITATGTNDFRLPDDPKSYRIEEFKYITGTFKEKFTLQQDKQSHELEVKPRQINSIETNVVKTLQCINNETEVFIDSDFILKTGTVVKKVYDPNNVIESIDYPIIKVKKQNNNSEIKVSFDVELYLKSSKLYNKNSLYELVGNSIVLPDQNYNNTQLTLTVDYIYDINIPYIPNHGIEGYGKVNDISGWEDKVKQGIETGYSPLYWVEAIKPGFVDIIKKDYLEGKPISGYKSKYLEYLNELINSTKFIQNGFEKTDDIDNLIFEKDYTDWTCRQINCLLIENTFPEFSISYNISANTPLIVVDNYLNLYKIELGYTYLPNSGRNNGVLQSGSDEYVMTHSEYKENIYNSIIEYDALTDIISGHIDDVIFLGAYIDNSEPTIITETRRVTINKELIQTDIDGYYYYINNLYHRDNLEAKITKTNTPEIESKLSIVGNTVRINIPVTKNINNDFKDILFPLILDISLIKRYNDNVKYYDLISDIFSDKIDGTDVLTSSITPVEFKFSSKPFIEEASTDLDEDYEIHLNKSYSSPINNYKYDNISVSVGNIRIDTEYSGETYKDYMEPAVYSAMTEEYCLKVSSGKIGINFTQVFSDIPYVTSDYVLKQDFITVADNKGIEVFASSGEDGYSVCVVSNNLHSNSILRYNKYKMIFKKILKIYVYEVSEILGGIGVNPQKFCEELSSAIDSDYGTILSHLSCTFDKYENGIHYYSLNITFKNTSQLVEIPLIIL